MSAPRILLIIPAYNEAETISNLADRLLAEFPQYDFVIVNDGSTDGTGQILRDKHYPFLELPLNLGIGGGVQTGYRYAVAQGYDIAIQLDGDGQHDPAYIDALIQPILSGEADMTIGSRFLKKEGFQTSAIRRMGIHYFNRLIRLLCGARVTDATSGFRAASRELCRLFAAEYAEDYPEPEAIVAATLHGFRVREVPVQMKERQGGVSSIKGLSSIYYMIKVTLALLIQRIGLAGSRRGKR